LPEKKKKKKGKKILPNYHATIIFRHQILKIIIKKKPNLYWLEKPGERKEKKRKEKKKTKEILPNRIRKRETKLNPLFSGNG